MQYFIHAKISEECKDITYLENKGSFGHIKHAIVELTK